MPGASAPETQQAYDYNLRGELVSHRQTIGWTTYTLGYSYTGLGQLASETYPSGRVVSNEYDGVGRMTGVRDATRQYASGMKYAAFGGLTEEVWGNGNVHTMSYNARLQPDAISLVQGGSVVQRYAYSYGEVNITNGSVDAMKNTGQVARVDAFICKSRNLI